MAKFAILTSKNAEHQYTPHWMRYICANYAIPVVPPDEADILLVSLCDVGEAAVLWEARKSGKPIILGGAEAFNDFPYIHLADGLCIGEGFQFFKELGEIAGGKADEILMKLEKLPYVLFGNKEAVIPSTEIDWTKCPPAKVGPQKQMVLAGRGCHRKCKFCFTSWTTKPCNSPHSFRGMSNVLLISNNNEGIEDLSQKVYVRSITAKGYLGMSPREAKTCRNYRIGLESFSEEQRKGLGKPISNEEVGKIFRISKKLGHSLRFFVLAGIDSQESITEFIETVGQDIALRPSVEMKVIWFNPCQHTPLRDFDIRNLHRWNKRWIYGKLKSTSSRFRLNMRADPGDAYFRAAFHRCRTREQAEEVWKWRNKPGEEILKRIEESGWKHLFNESPLTKVRFWWQKE